jgi:5'-deoxynucleotidase YfbR-like HD superfamily hydrolase
MTAEQIGNLFRAYDVKRYHTLPLHREQTVGDHTARVLALAFYLHWEAPSVDLVQAILEHDAYEFLTGDIPATAKWFGNFGKVVDELERRMDQAYTLNFRCCDKLSGEELLVLKVADMLELCCRCSAEVMMGNRFLNPIFQTGAKYLETLRIEMPEGMWEKVNVLLGPKPGGTTPPTH